MTINTSKIIGDVYLPSGAVREKSYVIFEMTGFDTDADDDAVVVPFPIRAPIADDASIDVDLWPNPEGVRSTFYNVTFEIYNGTKAHLVNAGKISVPVSGGPFALNDLLPVVPPSGADISDYIAYLAAAVADAESAAATAVVDADRAEVAADAASDSAVDAAASAIGAALYDTTLRFADLEAFRLSTRVSAGEGSEWIIGGVRYSEAASGAIDHQEVNAAGVKLYDLTPLHDAGPLRQRRQYEPFNGFDDGVTDTQIFQGSRLPPQGICRLTVDGVEYDFIALHDDSGGSDERFRIVQYEVGTGAHVAYSGILDINHCQDLSGSVSGSNVTLYSQMGDLDRNSKGVSVIDWKGAATTQADVTTYQVFGSSGSGHKFERYGGATVGVGHGRLVLLANDTKQDVDDTGHTLIVYDLDAVLAAPDPMDLDPIIGPISITIGAEDGQNTLQGCDVHADHFRLLRGFVNPRQRKLIQFWDYAGNLLSGVEYAGVLNDYSLDYIGDHPTLGSIITAEGEGLTSDALGRAILVTQEEWRAVGDVVSWEGVNVTPRRVSVMSSPENSDDWVVTTAASSGPWVAGTYSWGAAYTSRKHPVHVIDRPLASGADNPLGSPAQFMAAHSLIKGGSNGIDLVVPAGQDFLAGSFMGAVGKNRRLFGYYGANTLRIYDGREGADNAAYSSIWVERTDGRNYLARRADQDLTNGAGDNLYGMDDPTYPGWYRAFGGGVGGVSFMDYDPAAGITLFKSDLTVTGAVRLNRPTYADNAAALAGGLSVGDDYVTAAGDVKVVV